MNESTDLLVTPTAKPIQCFMMRLGDAFDPLKVAFVDLTSIYPAEKDRALARLYRFQFQSEEISLRAMEIFSICQQLFFGKVAGFGAPFASGTPRHRVLDARRAHAGTIHANFASPVC